eukprot:TRINITY_DN711_c0_g1_i1.p1 TRINITY_DN711_c0_g1~~TRINITY_DN711_c0_g1_i1.p1  ORF type:complete len:1438 (-),score=527.60 TRINITY_DN711_c0_g1_i1:225-4538(-)
MTSRILDLVDSGDPTDLFLLDQELAVGSFGTVYKAHDRTNQVVALKIVTLEEDENLDDLAIEIDILRRTNHSNVVGFFGGWIKGREIFIAMELCEGGSLLTIYEDFPKHVQPCTEAQIAFIVREMFKALAYLHSLNVIHRDLKMGNLLVTSRGQVKLADFGVSAQLTNQRPHRNTLIGTPYWMAPEVIRMDRLQPYDTRADIWSAAITAIELAEKDPPNSDLAPMRAMSSIPHEPPPTLLNPSDWSAEFGDFLAQCLQKDPRKRRTSAQMLEHAFLAEGRCADNLISLLLDPRREIGIQFDFDDVLATHGDQQAAQQLSPRSTVDGSRKWDNFLRQVEEMSAASVPRPTRRPVKTQTIIDPHTLRPVTMKENQNAQAQYQKQVIAKKQVKQQLKEIQKLQANQQRQIEQGQQKLTAEREQLVKAYVAKIKQLERQRADSGSQLAKTHITMREQQIREHQAAIKSLHRQMQSEQRFALKEYSEKQRVEYKDFRDGLKAKYKALKDQRKTQNSSSSALKAALKVDEVDQQHEELRFLQRQEMQKLIELHRSQLTNLSKHLQKGQQNMQEQHKLQWTHLVRENQLKADAQRALQELERERSVVRVPELLSTGQEPIFALAQQHLKALLVVHREQFARQLTAELANERKEYKAQLKANALIEVKKVSAAADKGVMSKKGAQQLQKTKKGEHKEQYAQQLKEFDAKQEQRRAHEEQQLQKSHELQFQELLESQDRERLQGLRETHDVEKKLMDEQHSEQVALAREQQTRMDDMLRQHCADELELQRGQESLFTTLLKEQQTQQAMLMTEHHDALKAKRSDSSTAVQLQHEKDALVARHLAESQKLSDKLSDQMRSLQASHRDRTGQLAKSNQDHMAKLLAYQQKEQQQRTAELKQLEADFARKLKINEAGSDGQTRLHLACTEGDYRKAAALIKNGVGLNVQDKSGWTAMHCAAYNRAKQIFALLLAQSDIDVTLTNVNGNTPLHYFARNFTFDAYDEDKEHLVELMIRQGASPNACNVNGESVLHNAMMAGNESVIKVLLDHGADVNVATPKGETCLHWAIRLNNPRLVSFLIERGADVQARGKEGAALEVVAKSGNNADILRIISAAAQSEPRLPPSFPPAATGIYATPPPTLLAASSTPPAYANQSAPTYAMSPARVPSAQSVASPPYNPGTSQSPSSNPGSLSGKPGNASSPTPSMRNALSRPDKPLPIPPARRSPAAGALAPAADGRSSNSSSSAGSAPSTPVRTPSPQESVGAAPPGVPASGGAHQPARAAATATVIAPPSQPGGYSSAESVYAATPTSAGGYGGNRPAESIYAATPTGHSGYGGNRPAESIYAVTPTSAGGYGGNQPAESIYSATPSGYSAYAATPSGPSVYAVTPAFVPSYAPQEPDRIYAATPAVCHPKEQPSAPVVPPRTSHAPPGAFSYLPARPDHKSPHR